MDYKGLKEYFSDENNIKNNIEICSGETVVNGKIFIKASFEALDKNSGNKTFRPYYDKLLLYYEKVK